MRLIRTIALCFVVALVGVLPVSAFEVISVPEDVNAVNLTGVVDIVPGAEGKVQLSTAPGDDGIIRRIEVLASENGINPNSNARSRNHPKPKSAMIADTPSCTLRP